MTARRDATAAGKAASAILAAAERRILTVMAGYGTGVIQGTVSAQQARRKLARDTAVILGAASTRLQQEYTATVRGITGTTGPLPDAPAQVATAVLRAQQDATVAFNAVLAAAGVDGSRMPSPSSPYRRIVTAATSRGPHGKAAAAALATIRERGLTGYTSPAGRRQPLATYAGRAVRTATSALARRPAMSQITARRDQLTAAHVKTVTAAWNQAAAGLNASDAVRAYLTDPRVTSTGQQPETLLQRWRKEAAQSAALVMLSRIWRQAGYATLLAAIGDAVRDGMAEGEADALALAAHRQGLPGFAITRAFAAAQARYQDDMTVTRAAQDTAEAMTRAVAAAVARVLASAQDTGEDELTGYVDTFLHGDDVDAVARWTEEALWTAFGAGAVSLYRQALGQAMGVKVDWNVDSSPCALCLENADGSPYSPYDVPAYPGHPHCRCWLTSDSSIPLPMLQPYVDAAA